MSKPVEKTYQPKASDVLMKVKEDPLFLIKKREEESRKELAMNPLKMQQMKVLLRRYFDSTCVISLRGPKRREKLVSKLRVRWECAKIDTVFLNYCMYFLHWK